MPAKWMQSTAWIATETITRPRSSQLGPCRWSIGVNSREASMGLQLLFGGQAEPAGAGGLGDVHDLDGPVEDYRAVGAYDHQFIGAAADFFLEPVEEPVQGQHLLADEGLALGVHVDGDGLLGLGRGGAGLGQLDLDAFVDHEVGGEQKVDQQHEDDVDQRGDGKLHRVAGFSSGMRKHGDVSFSRADGRRRP
ncbi:hypothetical protein DESC_590033 [Desulfosarcina cetonica]|nr:hypothetical protein DESC_590033 [Desulfosarcina cetonica]